MPALIRSRPASPVARGRRQWLSGAALLGLAGLSTMLMVSSLRGKSVTVDEFGHLPAGVNLLSTGDYRFAELNPPLMNALSALPAAGAGARVRQPADMPEELRHRFWANGYLFMEQHRAAYHGLFVRARLVTVALVVLTGLAVFAWMPSVVPLRGAWAGLLAAALLWFDPNIMAHGRLVTTDAGMLVATVFFVMALQAYLARPTWPRALAAGLALGAAQLIKFTAVWLWPAGAGLLLAGAWLRPGHRTWRYLLACLVIFATSLIVLDAGYGFGGVGRPLGGMRFSSGLFQAAAVSFAWMPSPLPEAFLAAFDQQLFDTRQGDPYFLFGRSSSGGTWYYFLALLAVKTPIATLALAAVAVWRTVRGKGLDRLTSLALLVPAAVIVLALSVFSNKQLGIRMVLPAIGLGLVWIAATLGRASWSRSGKLVIGGLLCALALDVALVHPNYLAYFNTLVGGPPHGYRFAVDSSLDWGQDLPRLRRYMDDSGLDRIQLFYFGRVDPGVYGIDYRVSDDRLLPGHLAVSRSFYGRGYFVYDHGDIRWLDPVRLPPGRVEHVATLNHTIDIFRIDP